MSRRRTKAWEELLERHRFMHGECVEDLWRAVASEVGVTIEDFESPAFHYEKSSNSETEVITLSLGAVEYSGDMELDIAGISAAARELFFDRREGRLPSLALLTLKCQRCDRRLDAFRLWSKGWTAPMPGSGEGWKLDDLRIGSEVWSKEIGDDTIQMFKHFAGRAFPYTCPCGRRDIQFSPIRIEDTLVGLAPDRPRWVGPGDDAEIVWPGTRFASIRG